MMPGGIATAVMAVACGRMLTGNRPLVDPRILILSGMALMLFAMWTLAHLSTAAGESDARYALILRGLSLGLLFSAVSISS
jgi:DHA2 family multidrug resistance protein